MIYFLQDYCLFFADPTGDISFLPCARVPPNNFPDGLFYQEFIRQILRGISESLLSGGSVLLVTERDMQALPGFTEQLKDTIPPGWQVVSALQFSFQILSSEAFGSSIELTGQGLTCSHFHSTETYQLEDLAFGAGDLDALLRSVFGRFLHADRTFSEFKAQLFSYFTIHRLNSFEQEFIHDSCYANWTLADTPLGGLMTIDFATFYDGIKEIINTILNRLPETLGPFVLKSPLFDCLPEQKWETLGLRRFSYFPATLKMAAEVFQVTAVKPTIWTVNLNGTHQFMMPCAVFILLNISDPIIEFEVPGIAPRQYQVNLQPLQRQLEENSFLSSGLKLAKIESHFDRDEYQHLRVAFRLPDQSIYYYLFAN